MNSIFTITRPGSVADGKPKIYLACHDADFDAFSKLIAADLLKSSDCAVYVRNPYAPCDKVLLEEYLSQMALFVVVVTSRLLSDTNSVADTEIKIAKQRKMPILPITVQDGLEQAFAHKFGSLQFLSRNSKGNSELSYEDKLKKYLEAVLLQDKDLADVRNEFNAGIFLSYRKTDRRYAQQLMKNIHRNDTFRDVAIWYDEFLTPGEDYNQEIQQKLEKSDLFLMTVTPNLVNEHNYIQTVEYPAAIRNRKKIVAAEMRKLSFFQRNKYKKLYRNAPDTLNGDDLQSLSDALLDFLNSSVLRRNRNDALHCYKIGLAYLNGIDVEVDFDKAIDLITYAADENIRDAVKKVTDMYWYGQGVDIDYDESFKWNRRLISILKENFANDHTEQNGTKYTMETVEFGSRLKELSRYSEAREVFGALLQDLQSNEFNYMLYMREACHAYLGGIAYDLGEYETAENELLQDIESKQIHFSLAVDAKRRLQMGETLNPPFTPQIIDAFIASGTNISKACIKLINIADKLGDAEKAEKYNRLLEETIKTIQNSGVVDSVDNAASELESDKDAYYEHQAKLAGECGDLKTARKYAEMCFAIREKQYRDGTNREALHNMFAIYQLFGIISANEGNYARAEKEFEKCLEYARQLYRERPTPDNATDVRIAENCMEKIKILQNK